jgi:hypothetical protein
MESLRMARVSTLRAYARQGSAGEDVDDRALADIVAAENDQMAQSVVAHHAADPIADQSIDQQELPTEPSDVFTAAEKTLCHHGSSVVADKAAVDVAFVKPIEIVNDLFQRFAQHRRTPTR